MSRFHRHVYGKVEADGFQYCTKCGHAIKPTIPPPPPCQHIWEEVAKGIISTQGLYDLNARQIGNDYTMRCSKCGEMKHQIFRIDGR